MSKKFLTVVATVLLVAGGNYLNLDVAEVVRIMRLIAEYV